MTVAIERTGFIPTGGGPGDGGPTGGEQPGGEQPDGGWMYSFLCRPPAPPRPGGRTSAPAVVGGAGGGGIVLLAPLAEERKSSLRAFVEIARSLASAGLAALRIDFRGTGDSSGTSGDISIDSMVEDAVAASAYLRDSEACARVAFAGLRLGAAVAVMAAERAGVEALALVEPVVKGERYVREIERKQAIRRMLTRGKGAPAPSGRPGGEPDEARAKGNETGGGPFDLDGLALDRAFLDSLRRIDLVESVGSVGSIGGTRAPRETDGPGVPRPEKASKKAPPSLVLQVGARKSASPQATELAEALGDPAELAVLVAEPFWLQTDYVDPAPAAERLTEFLPRVLGVRG